MKTRDASEILGPVADDPLVAAITEEMRKRGIAVHPGLETGEGDLIS